MSRLSKSVALCAVGFLIMSMSVAQAAETTFEGVFQIVYGESIDFTSGRQIYILTEANGDDHQIDAAPQAFSQSPDTLQGDHVRVKGIQDARGTIHASDVDSAQQGSDQGAGVDAAVTGSTAWAVLTCKYSDIATETNPLSFYTSLMDGSFPRLDHFWKAQSYNQMNLSGTAAYGWFTLPQPQSYYTNTANSDGTNLTNLANDCTAAANATVNFSTFFGVLIMVNGTVTGGAGGWGGGRNMTLDGVTKVWPFAWMPSTGHRPGVIGHEMGHGYGLPHSSALPYPSGGDYQSDWDVMSSGFWSAGATYAPYSSAGTGTIAYHRDKLGWVAGSRKFTPATGSQTTITLWPLGDGLPSGSQYQMAQIAIPSSTNFYTVEARKKRTGLEYYDNGLPNEGIVIHTVNPDTGATGRSADALVVDGDTDYVASPDPGEIWIPGETFDDPANGVKVEVLAANADGSYQVRIGYGIVGFSIVESSGTTQVTEGGATDSYTVRLNTAPTASVTVTPAHSAGQVTLSAPLTFTTANWATPQTVTVTAVNDTTPEASPHTATITHTATSADAAYNGLPVPSVVAQIIDNEAGLTFTETSGTAVTEGGATDTYTVKLMSAPTANVTVTPNGAGEVTLSPAALTFTSANWATAQTLTVTAVNDQYDEPSPESVVVAHATASTDPAYSGLTGQNVIVSVIDNDLPGITLSKTTTSSAEGASDSYTITLLSRPAANVVVALTTSNAQVSVPATVTFTTGGALAQAVSVVAVNDDYDDGNTTTTITHAVSSSDPAYAGLTLGPVTATTLDNDISGVTLVQSGGSTAVAEGGATDSYTIVLTARPTAAVTVTITPNSQLTVSPGSVTFTGPDWNTAKTVTVTAVDDTLSEAPQHTGTIAHTVSSADSIYNGLPVPGITVTITDNDDRQAPSSTFTTGNQSVLLFGSSVRGTTTDAGSGVTTVDLIFTPLTGGAQVRGTQISCNAGRTSCTWYYVLPTSMLPGIYDVRAVGRDVVGNVENPGPTIRVVIV